MGWACVADSVSGVICRWCSDDGTVLIQRCVDDVGMMRTRQKEEEEEAGGGGRIVQEKQKASQGDRGKKWCLILL